MELIDCEDFLVYGKDDIIVGDINFDITSKDKIFVNMFKIDDKYQQYGLGSEMLTAMVSYFSNLGYKEIVLEAIPQDVNLSENKLIQFYERGGFENLYQGTSYMVKYIDRYK